MAALPPDPVAAGAAAAAAAEDGDSVSEYSSDSDGESGDGAVHPLAGVAAEVSAALINKLREKAYENRQRLVEKRNSDEKLLFPFTWSYMSTESQSKVREDPDFERAYAELDVVKLWKFIRRSHLTHIYGDDDSMSYVNIHDQSVRYNHMRQGDREYIADFKTRFDNQVKANQGVGIPEIDDALRAMDFIGKLDIKRYGGMLTFMRNSASQNLPGAYPKTLAAAFRTASTWTRDGMLVPLSGDSHTAFLADDVTKLKDPKDSKPSAGGKKEKKERLGSSGSLTCFVCGKTGHLARECLHRKTSEKALVTSSEPDEDEFRGEAYLGEFDNEAAFITSEETVLLTKADVVFDSGATISLFHNEDFLTGITSSRNTIVLGGVQADAAGVQISQEGIFADVGKVYFSKNASANILSMAALREAGADIRYDHVQNRFTVQPAGSGNVYSFRTKQLAGSESKFYICDGRSIVKKTKPELVLVQTVASNLAQYTKREVASAQKARELLAKMGYPSVETAISMIRDGSDFDVTEYDFKVANAIWGPDIASMKGKQVRTVTRSADVTLGVPVVQQQQIMAVDIMFIDQVATVVAVCHPLDLTLGVTLDRSATGRSLRTAEAVKKCIDIMIATLSSRLFKVLLIMSDGEGAIGKLKSYLQSLGMEIDISGAGGHVPRIERRIRVIKERVRTHICGRLPFVLTIIGLSYLILYCISRINYQQSGSRPGGLTPREAFTGQRVVATRDFRAAFGDYVQSTVPETTKLMIPRTDDMIVYLPTGNRTGSVKMLNLATGLIVTRDNFKILPMPQSVVLLLNAMAKRDGRVPTIPNTIHDLVYNQSVNNANMPTFMPAMPPNREDNPAALIPDNLPLLADLDPITNRDEVGGDAPLVPLELVPGSNQPQPDHSQPDDQNIEDEPDGPEAPPVDEPRDLPVAQPILPQPAQVRRVMDFFRTGEGALVASAVDTERVAVKLSGSAVEKITEILEKKKQVSFVDPSANVSVNVALRTRGDDAKRVINKELQQMLDKRVWTPVMADRLSRSERLNTITSLMFLKTKNSPDGKFDKYKARLVASGNQQNKTLYEDLSSPTASTSGVFTVIAIAAHENRLSAVVDIGGAFLHADMTKGISVHMSLDRTMSDFVVQLDETYSKYRDSKGRITVLLKKALYGCVESAALWYENLRATLGSLGYKRNERDVCVFNRVNKTGQQCTISVHVDDLLITSVNKLMISELVDGLRTRYGEITHTNGPSLNYLGMSIDLTHAGEARITMAGYVSEVLSASGVTGVARTPATDGLFELRGDSDPVSEGVRVWFHRVVAQLLYLAKRVRPECLTAVAYLATRVTRCDGHDVEKLYRLVRYIRWTSDLGIVLRPGVSGITVRLFVDASYGVHADGKSHTGSCVVIGDVGAVHCRSTKQAIVTKSSTEAELVGLSDSSNQALHMRSFLVCQGYEMPPVVVYQDNMSCMALVERGRSGAERTRRIDIRYFWVKERVDKGEMKIEHKGTKEMYANVLTKPLQGSQFAYERESLTGWELSKGAGLV